MVCCSTSISPQAPVSLGVNRHVPLCVSSSPAPLLSDFHDTSSVKTIFPMEEDPRLLVRLEAFGLPILVGTLLSGFTLVSNSEIPGVAV